MYWSRLSRLVPLAAALLIAGQAHAVPPYENTTTGALADTVTPCTGPLLRTITVSDVVTIADLDLGVLLSHTYRGDLRMSLTSPQNTTVLLVGQNGGVAVDNYNIRFSDEAPVLINNGTHTATDTLPPAAPAYTNSVRPQNPLTAFDGQQAQGTWTLSICDAFAQDTGNFTSAELFITPTGAPSGPVALTCGASALRHDWNDHAWPAGTLTNQYADAGEDFRVTIAGSTGNLVNEPVTAQASPVTSTYLSGGQGGGQQALFLAQDQPNRANTVTMTIDIGDLSGGPNPGAGELQFQMFDVDFGANQFQDRVSISGTDGVSTFSPLVQPGAANTASGPVATGSAVAVDAGGDGTITVTFLQTVSQVTITYGNGASTPTNPGQQWLALSDILTCPVQTAMLEAEKTTRTVNDLYALPGNDVLYTITIRNVGLGAADSNSIFLVDSMPPEVEFFRGAANSDAVSFSGVGTGLTYTYATDIAYATGTTRPTSFAQCSYAPATGYDPAVTFICFNPKGALAAGTPDPEFSFEFRARIK